MFFEERKSKDKNDLKNQLSCLRFLFFAFVIYFCAFLFISLCFFFQFLFSFSFVRKACSYLCFCKNKIFLFLQKQNVNLNNFRIKKNLESFLNLHLGLILSIKGIT